MDKVYNIVLNGRLIGTTVFEHADAPMGVVFGQINFINVPEPYYFIKAYCLKNNIGFDDIPESKLISTRTIPALKIMNNEGQEIKGIGNQISGMESDTFELVLEGIPYPFYAEEFPHHVKAYAERFK